MNILNNGYFVGSRCNYTEHDKVCIPVPLYHCFGMVLGVLACINYGSAAILCSEGFSSKETLKACSAYQCTSLYGVPRMFQEVLKEYEKD